MRQHQPAIESCSMGFEVFSLSLAQAIDDSVREIHRELFAGPVPRAFYHYTALDKVESIVQSRSIWATCINDQTDQGEISHAVGLVTQAAEQVARSDSSSFARDVLGRLPYFMEERKKWMFIACFCEDSESAVHWERYGNYCLALSAPWTGMKALAISNPRAECWYQRVIYNEERQRNVVEEAVRSVVLALTVRG